MPRVWPVCDPILAGGAAPLLSASELEELRAIVIEGPDPERHKVVRWRRIDLCEEVARRWSVTVCEQTVGRWLRQLRMTRLQPRPVHPKKDHEAEVAFKNVWPAPSASVFSRSG